AAVRGGGGPGGGGTRPGAGPGPRARRGPHTGPGPPTRAGPPPGPPPAGESTPPPVKSWEQMREWAARLLESRTGEDVQAWNRRVAGTGLADEAALRSWLGEQGVTGYAQALLGWERFGYPDFAPADARAPRGGQRPARRPLRPVRGAWLAALPALSRATVRGRKTLVGLVGPRRAFAVVQATTKSRVDLGLRLDPERPGGRLL